MWRASRSRSSIRADATLLWAAHAKVENASGFVDYFWFTTQNSVTIGFGHYYPLDTFSHVIVTVASLTGVAFAAVATGVAFARFSTTTAKVIFSRSA